MKSEVLRIGDLADNLYAYNVLRDKKQARAVVEAVFERIKFEVLKGNRVEIDGFGHFYPKVNQSKELPECLAKSSSKARTDKTVTLAFSRSSGARKVVNNEN